MNFQVGKMALHEVWRKNWPELRCALSGGMPSFVLARNPQALTDEVPAFCYHVVEPDSFEADLCYLKENGYRTVDADAMLDHLEGRSVLQPRTVVLCIDDGAVNLYHVAFPLLRKYETKAIAFIAPCFHKAVSNHPAKSYADNTQRPCTWNEIIEMHESGALDFQSHTYEHRHVAHWPKPAPLLGISAEWQQRSRSQGMSIEEDIRTAKQELEQHLNKVVQHLSFPQYNGTDEAIRLGQACGYRGFWWGVLPHHRDNFPQQSPTHIVRISGELVQRLPGVGRRSLAGILRARYGRSIHRRLSSERGSADKVMTQESES